MAIVHCSIQYIKLHSTATKKAYLIISSNIFRKFKITIIGRDIYTKLHMKQFRHKIRTNKSASVLILGTFCIGLAEFIFLSERYYALRSATLDLGLFGQAFWLISHGYWSGFTTMMPHPAIGLDFDLMLYPLSVIYRFFGGIMAIFLIQIISVCIATWGIFRVARLHNFTPNHAAVLGFIFLLAPGIVSGTLNDFHPDFIAVSFIIWGYVFYRKHRILSYYISMLDKS